MWIAGKLVQLDMDLEAETSSTGILVGGFLPQADVQI